MASGTVTDDRLLKLPEERQIQLLTLLRGALAVADVLEAGRDGGMLAARTDRDLRALLRKALVDADGIACSMEL